MDTQETDEKTIEETNKDRNNCLLEVWRPGLAVSLGTGGTFSALWNEFKMRIGYSLAETEVTLSIV